MKSWLPRAAKPPNSRPNMVVLLSAFVWWGCVFCWCGSWKMDLRRGGGPGKVEKLLRSDPRLNVVVVPGVSVV